MIMLTACFAFIGCLSLALSQNKHWKTVTGTTLLAQNQKSIRVIGWVLLSVAFPVCIKIEGLGFAILLWPLLLAAASFIIAMMLSFCPKLLLPVARIYSVF